MKRLFLIITAFVILIVVNIGCTLPETTAPTPTYPTAPLPSPPSPTPAPVPAPIDPLERTKQEVDSYFAQRGSAPYYKGVARVESQVLSYVAVEKLDGILRDIGLIAWRQFKCDWASLYHVNVFDCSEMSAFLEYILENKGFTTKIAVGGTELGNHAWLFVYFGGNEWQPVESTGPLRPGPLGIMLNDAVSKALGIKKISYHDYFSPKYVYDTIYEAETALPGDFDWWDSSQGQRLIWGK